MVHVKPIRRITSPQDLDKWIDSETYNLVVCFVEKLQNLVLGLTNDHKVEVSEPVNNLLRILDRVENIVNENPVLHDKNVSRFGKVEFRDFYDQLVKESQELTGSLIEKIQDRESATLELATYLNESWGNRTRIDYGSGHELNFLAFILCCNQLGIIQESDYAAVILKVFTKYISIMRSLQKNYWLEPAGSHGVWGLDDYHFLPFLFGAAQLATHPYIKPKLIHNDELIETYYHQYMYFECIHFINSIKTVPTNQEKLSLRWHSPMLDDILSARSWIKIKEGMVKMYKAEVLQKLPIIQHFMFGSIITCPNGVREPVSDDSDDNDHDSHNHEFHNTWGDCCGIKIPSGIAASELLRLAAQQNHKPVPFD